MDPSTRRVCCKVQQFLVTVSSQRIQVLLYVTLQSWARCSQHSSRNISPAPSGSSSLEGTATLCGLPDPEDEGTVFNKNTENTLIQQHSIIAEKT
jgi:hypothetical protein